MNTHPAGLGEWLYRDVHGTSTLTPQVWAGDVLSDLRGEVFERHHAEVLVPRARTEVTRAGAIGLERPSHPSTP